MALVGYARVSSVGQNLDIQLDKLGHCDKIFQEKTSGASSQRPRLADCLEYVREGDTVVVTRLDRLARSTLTFPLCCFDQISCWLPRNIP
jgi:DNA invertase Pin-like site-specific DNA recombinase